MLLSVAARFWEAVNRDGADRCHGVHDHEMFPSAAHTATRRATAKQPPRRVSFRADHAYG